MRRVALQVVAERLQVLGFAAIVELSHQRASKFLNHLAEAKTSADVSLRVGEFCDSLDRVHVLDDLGSDAGSLDLHCHLAPITQLGRVHLAQRGGRKGCLVEACERL